MDGYEKKLVNMIFECILIKLSTSVCYDERINTIDLHGYSLRVKVIMGKYGNSSEHDEQIVCFDQILNLIRIAHNERMRNMIFECILIKLSTSVCYDERINTIDLHGHSLRFKVIIGKCGNSSEHDEQIVCFDQILNLIRIAHNERMNPILKGQKSSPNVEYIGMLCCVLPLFKLYILLVKRE